jgi:3',5'-cyclic-AMP phosphodiesterase
MPTRSHCIVHFSDIHLRTEGTVGPGVRPRDNLVRALAVVAAQDIKPDFFVLTGDLTDNGEPAAYQELHDIMSGAASMLGAEVIYLPGNHDDRAHLRRCATGEPGSSKPLNQVFWRGGLRLVALDSTVPGKGWGELDARTLAFLTAHLAAPADEGTVLAFHHPPVPSPIAEMARLSLRKPNQLSVGRPDRSRTSHRLASPKCHSRLLRFTDICSNQNGAALM